MRRREITGEDATRQINKAEKINGQNIPTRFPITANNEVSMSDFMREVIHSAERVRNGSTETVNASNWSDEEFMSFLLKKK